ncbi:MAG: hypothetical protein AUJ71_04355 [Candidatus Omnitrophica bacterium CG1_02_49_16]|nr:MAG: hypothetical protein AUJ71_04355 [Candidatus Omnitrophica bacterium CG1_02_49_16]
MSKIIETLKVQTIESKKKETGLAQEARNKKTDHELTQEQLADIYFAGPEKIKKSDYPTVIRVADRSRSSSLAPWLITAVAVIIAVSSLYSTRRIFVDVKIINDGAASLASPKDILEVNQAAGGDSPKALRFGDKLYPVNFDFEGAAKLKSSKDFSTLTLVNSSVAPFARAILRFDAPVNLSGAKIIFYAKGLRGGENIAFALKDKDNVSAFNKNKFYPFPNVLTTDWQRAEIIPIGALRGFDVKNVTSLRFEVGSKDTDNKPGDTILVKDIQVVPL